MSRYIADIMQRPKKQQANWVQKGDEEEVKTIQTSGQKSSHGRDSRISTRGHYPCPALDKVAINPKHPQQNTWKFASGIVISSEFDSGNLGWCTLEDGD